MLDGGELHTALSWSRGKGRAQKNELGPHPRYVSLARSLRVQSLCAPTLIVECSAASSLRVPRSISHDTCSLEGQSLVCYSHSVLRKIEAQREQNTCPTSHRAQWQSSIRTLKATSRSFTLLRGSTKDSVPEVA